MKNAIYFMTLINMLNVFHNLSADDSISATDLIVFPNAKEVIVGVDYFSASLEYKWQYLSRNYSTTKFDARGVDYSIEYALNDYWGVSVSAE